MNKLFIISKEKEKYCHLFEQADLPEIELCNDLRKANIVLAEPPMAKHIIDQLESLVWLQSTFAGIDALTKPDLRQDYTLTNIKGIFGQLISEYVLGYSIQHFRHFQQYAKQQADKQWQPHYYTSLENKRMVILGTGSIGNHLAKSAKVLNFEVFGINRSGHPPEDSAFDQVFHVSEMEKTFNEADVIVCTLPKTEQTIHLLNKQTLSHCNGALFFNVGRGDVIESSGLLQALESQSISHAFLDVFINEPISQECPYWHHPNITVTPHIAAISFPEQAFEQFASNYLRWVGGKPLQNQVDFKKGY